MQPTLLAGHSPSSALRLRGYQEEAIAAIAAARGRGVSRQLVVLPTGSGKTVIFAHMAAANPGRTLILVHRDELVRQTIEKLLTVDPGLDTGVVKADLDDHASQVVVASVQTLARPARLDRVTADFGLVIVDEAHHAVAASYVRILEAMGCLADDGPLTVGFTATAARGDRSPLGAIWQEITYQRGILRMIADGYLTDVRALRVMSDVDLRRVQTSGGDFADSSLGLELARSQSLEAAAIAYRRYAADRKGVAFTPTVATSLELTRRLVAQGIAAEHLDGTTEPDERRRILARLASGETQVVANCMVLTEGWDEPSVSCMLSCRPTKNRGLFVQMAGRILRPHPGKEDALILDLAGAADLGLATVADLAGLPPGAVRDGESLQDAADRQLREQQDRRVVAALYAQQVELFRKSRLRWLELENDLGWALAAGRETILLVPAGADQWNVYRTAYRMAPVRESERPVPLNWAMGVGEEIARQVAPVLAKAGASWRSRPRTDPQRRALWAIGIRGRAADNLTRGEAADAITRHDAAASARRIASSGQHSPG